VSDVPAFQRRRSEILRECAAPLAGTCVHCGYQLPPSARFCPQCAQPTDAASVQAGSPQDYTPEHLAKKILGSRTALEGGRKQATAQGDVPFQK
jgi:hypothetical protein